MLRRELTLQQLRRRLGAKLRGEKSQRIALALVITLDRCRQDLRRLGAEIEHFERHRGTRRQPAGQVRDFTRARLCSAAAQQGATVLDKQGGAIVRPGQGQGFRNQCVGMDAMLGERIDPAAQHVARDHGDHDRRIAGSGAEREVQFLDRAGEAILECERHCLGELRTLLRQRRRIEQQHLFGRHEHDDPLRARQRLRRRRARARTGQRAAAGILGQPGQRSVIVQAQQQSIGHGYPCREFQRDSSS